MALKRWTRVGFVEGPENRSGGDCDRIAVHFADEPDGGGLSFFGVRCLAAEEHRVYPTGLSPFRDDHKMRPRIFILAYLQSKSWSFHLSLRMQRCDGEKKREQVGWQYASTDPSRGSSLFRNKARRAVALRRMQVYS